MPVKCRVAIVTSILAAVIAIGPGSAIAGPTPDGFQRGWGETKAQCIKDESTGLVFAHVTTSMWVHNRGQGGHWVTNLRLKARLVPTTAGLNIPRSWRTNRFPVHSDLLQDHDYSHAMAVNTDVVDPEAEWRVQVKQIWDRKVPWGDIVREFYLSFDTGHCRKGKPYSPPTPPVGTAVL